MLKCIVPQMKEGKFANESHTFMCRDPEPVSFHAHLGFILCNYVQYQRLTLLNLPLKCPTIYFDLIP
jgi:hypothetical protein